MRKLINLLIQCTHTDSIVLHLFIFGFIISLEVFLVVLLWFGRSFFEIYPVSTVKIDEDFMTIEIHLFIFVLKWLLVLVEYLQSMLFAFGDFAFNSQIKTKS